MTSNVIVVFGAAPVLFKWSLPSWAECRLHARFTKRNVAGLNPFDGDLYQDTVPESHWLGKLNAVLTWWRLRVYDTVKLMLPDLHCFFKNTKNHFEIPKYMMHKIVCRCKQRST